MRKKPYFQALLAAMRQALHHLEDLKSIRHDDPEISELRQVIKGKIEEFESEDSMELESSGGD